MIDVEVSLSVKIYGFKQTLILANDIPLNVLVFYLVINVNIWVCIQYLSLLYYLIMKNKLHYIEIILM